MVEWLDEPVPSGFRQAQVSFSACIPKAFPVADATTLNRHLAIYVQHKLLDIKEAALRMSDETWKCSSEKSQSQASANPMGRDSPGQISTCFSTNVLLQTKHTNGSLNLWQVSFGEKSKFQTVLSIAHSSRVCGHRFRTNDIKCHPVLPLLLTTSHHNLSLGPNYLSRLCFCSELILWKVDAVGPLSKSGGIRELARLSSPEISAFSNVAWLPTLLPRLVLAACLVLLISVTKLRYKIMLSLLVMKNFNQDSANGSLNFFSVTRLLTLCVDVVLARVWGPYQTPQVQCLLPLMG